MSDYFLPPGGGYRKLKAYQIAEAICDLTSLFVKKYVPRNSRTCDQMEQAARSGKQNIAEGSVASPTSKETEIKLTNVAKASLEELILDYEDIENVSYRLQDDILNNGKIIINLKEILEEETIEDLENLIKIIDTDNMAINVFMPKENQKE